MKDVTECNAKYDGFHVRLNGRRYILNVTKAMKDLFIMLFSFFFRYRDWLFLYIDKHNK